MRQAIKLDNISAEGDVYAQKHLQVSFMLLVFTLWKGLLVSLLSLPMLVIVVNMLPIQVIVAF